MFLSIIIPVYNAQKYLDECLQSCLCQDLDKNEYQIICVNDGSKDNSLSILKEYEKNFSNVIVVDQVNKGVSAARNAGIKMAEGDFIWFVDSDDFIKSNCLSELKKLACNGYDIINFGAYSFNEELTDREDELRKKGEIKPNKSYWGYACFHLYGRSVIFENNILLNEDIKYGEDEMFYNDVFSYAKEVLEINEAYYYYRLNSTSSMSTLSVPENQIKRLESIILSMVILKKGIESGKYTKDFSENFLKKRYELVQRCIKNFPVKIARKYFELMKDYELFSVGCNEIKQLNLPGELQMKKIYYLQKFKVSFKAFYKKFRTRIKKLLPACVVKALKTVFRLAD